MSKKIMWLLVAACLCSFGITAIVLHQSSRSTTPAKEIAGATPTKAISTAPAYAYITDRGLVLMRGSQVVAQVPRLFNPGQGYGDQVRWTETGDYVAFLSTMPDHGLNLDHQELEFINTHTGAVGHAPCSECTGFIAIGSNNILAQGYNVHGHVLEFDLSSPRPGEPIALSESLGSVNWGNFLASTRNLILVSGADSNDNEYLQLYKADGSTGFKFTGFGNGYIQAEAADRTTYGSAETAVMVAGGQSGTCQEENTVELLDPVTGQEVLTDMSAVRPSDYVVNGSGGMEVRDFWWGLDGHLRATMQSWTCDNTKPDEQSKKILAKQSSLWRLDGKKWVQEDPSLETMVRQIDQSTKITLEIPNCNRHVDASVFASNPLYCFAGKLYNDHGGKRAFIADRVMSISTPPSLGAPVLSSPLPANTWVNSG